MDLIRRPPRTSPLARPSSPADSHGTHDSGLRDGSHGRDDMGACRAVAAEEDHGGSLHKTRLHEDARALARCAVGVQGDGNAAGLLLRSMCNGRLNKTGRWNALRRCLDGNFLAGKAEAASAWN